jgi:uncharacterized protein (DUF1697 family)
MPVIIALLRGVNVLANNRMKMDELRGVCKSLKLKDPQTYIQSGNVIFATEEKDTLKLANKLEDAIEKKFGFRPAVVLRTTAEVRSVVAKNPFAGREDVAPNKLLVTFHAEDPGREAREKVLAIQGYPEELHFFGRELYIYFPEGMGRTKLPLASIQRIIKVPGTARNWNSVKKILEMSVKKEAS